MTRTLTVTAALLLLAGSRIAAAQVSPEEGEPAHSSEYEEESLVPMVGFNFAGMASFPLADSSDAFNPGAGFAAGVMFRPSPYVGFQFEYSYSWYDIKSDLLANTQLDGNHTMQYWDLNVVARPARSKRFGFYVIAGPGIYRRMAQVTKVEGVGVGTYCDPWLYFCYPSAVPIEDVLADRHSTDFGVNAGLGAYLVLSPPLRLYLEARYHYIWGPDFHTAGGKTRSADGQYLPITFGIAF